MMKSYPGRTRGVASLPVPQGLMRSLQVVLLHSLSLLVGCVRAPLDPEHPNLLVIDIDSLRADRIDRAYDGRYVLPTIRSLAARGVRFDQYITQGGWTQPALTSLLSGHHPLALEVTTATTALFPAGARRVSEILGMYGYHTAALWSEGVPTCLESVGRGLTYQHVREEALPTGDDAMERYEAWLDSGVEPPFFLLLHDFDAHFPPSELLKQNQYRFVQPLKGCRHGTYNDVLASIEAYAGRDAATAHVAGHYDGVLAAYDDLLARFLHLLDERDLLENTIIVVTSNHGEDLGEHLSGFNHGTLYDSVVHVPLIVSGPGIGPAGAVVDLPVQTIDIAPTLLELAHIPADLTMDGRSFASVLRGGSTADLPADRPAFILTNLRALAVRTTTRKLMLLDRADRMVAIGSEPVTDGRGPHYEYYDLRTDPGETQDLFESSPEQGLDLMEALMRFQAERAAATASGEGLVVDDKLKAVLQKQGYWNVVGGRAP